jgi:hypothetical protein
MRITLGRGASTAALIAAGLALTACGQGTAQASGTVSHSGVSKASNASNSLNLSNSSNSSGSSSSSVTTQTGASGTGAKGSNAGDSASSSGGRGSGDRCTASELRGSVGDNEPGAGQENFPLIVTNFSDHTCTLYGYPGAAFVDASGKQLGPDPQRATASDGAASPAKITLAPGKSAWAGLSFGNPEVSGADKATPSGILITPPDEQRSLKVDWTQGAVPVSSAARLMPFQPGTGA